MKRKNIWIVGLATAACAAAAGTAVMSAAASELQPAVEKDLGGGAPTRVLLDNETMRVTLVSFPAGFKREGGLRRRMEQIIVYVDDGEFKITPQPGAQPNPKPGPNAGKRGPES